MTKIKTNDLKPGSEVLIKGTVSFSRITKKFEGSELKAQIDRAREVGVQHPVTVPYTTITLTNAQVVFNDPTQPTLEEQYFDAGLYYSKKHPENGKMYTADNKGNSIPDHFILKNKVATRTFFENELAPGSEVLIIMRIFKASPQNGKALEGVITNGAPKYYDGGGGTEQTLLKRGFTVEQDPNLLQKQKAAQLATQEIPQETPAPTNTPTNNPFPTPQTQQPDPAQAQSAPNFGGNAFSNFENTPQKDDPFSNVEPSTNNVGGIVFNPENK